MRSFPSSAIISTTNEVNALVVEALAKSVCVFTESLRAELAHAVPFANTTESSFTTAIASPGTFQSFTPAGDVGIEAREGRLGERCGREEASAAARQARREAERCSDHAAKLRRVGRRTPVAARRRDPRMYERERRGAPVHPAFRLEKVR